ncbi:MAG TPA: HIT family protein [Candidatus Dormibacteraeota bacterium]|nr:HIT family protein [Candidatus Dormibacteraeota bacterium]
MRGKAPISPADQRMPMDLEAYERRVRSGPCFICAFLVGVPECAHERVYEDETHIAFLDAHPTLLGRVLVAPKAHVVHVVRDLDEGVYLQLMAVVRRVALAVERVVPLERTYLLSLGSQQGNSHLHWHIAPFPPGAPHRRQRFHALLLENGVLTWSAEEAAALRHRIRAAVEA